ncbi:OmpA family protein [Mucilaginibacter sp. UR6-11]|uniref:OmpA family protein n=1 Tax=Mucilaginibacter sp. UR6-11 TaxID=1435644 RepID=UPI001E31A759|nr:OmpA family protein [Mucilaginibacter sp. UR6-11]MCC8427157.1 OmpA family protein [Mucilaginibacter sp. UR6-11]
MKFLRTLNFSIFILSAVIALDACKAKKPVQTPVAPVEETTPPPAAAKPAPAEEAARPAPAPVVQAPDYNFSNIQFEFNSGILKTASYPIMDRAAAEMKKEPSVKFILNGHASAEGTDAHNMSLSVERATAVKAYLVNSGISADNLEVKGYGDKKPVADNSSEAGRAKNRRVEIKKL